MSRQERRSLASRILIDVGVGLGILLAAGIGVLYTVRTGNDVPMKWLELAGFTPLIFWAALKQFKQYWGRPSLWLAAFGLLVIHVAVFTLVLTEYPQWRPVWFLLVALPEGWAIVLILHKLIIGDLRSRHRNASNVG